MKCGACNSHNVQLKQGRKGFYYECMDCHAKVGCHRGTKTPMGTTANKEMRILRRKCHEIFDSMWQNGYQRAMLYRKLSDKMGMPPKKCHFAKMNIEELRRAIHILRNWNAFY